jgi:hypothetical protein
MLLERIGSNVNRVGHYLRLALAPAIREKVLGPRSTVLRECGGIERKGADGEFKRLAFFVTIDQKLPRTMGRHPR